jgi:nucleoside-diphosphate-sugar epimerase
MPPERRALVTGATGFLGGHLARRLTGDGWTVHLLGRGEDAAEAVRRARPDAVFHLASYFKAVHEPADVAPLIEANVAFGARLLEAMAGAGCGRLVHAGTAWQHFEGRPYEPTSLYAATKQAFADLVRFYVAKGALRSVALKIYDTYGPADPRPKLMNQLKNAARSGARLELSAGEQYLDLVYVDDVVDAFVRAAGVEAADANFSVSSGSPRRVRDVVELYARVAGRPINAVWGARPYRWREMLEPWSAGPPVPGWAPRVPLEEGIRRIVADG